MTSKHEHENKPQRLAKIYQRIKHVRGLDEHEKILYARSLAATPDERWQMNETFLRSFGLWGRSSLKKFASNS